MGKKLLIMIVVLGIGIILSSSCLLALTDEVTSADEADSAVLTEEAAKTHSDPERFQQFKSDRDDYRLGRSILRLDPKDIPYNWKEGNGNISEGTSYELEW